MTKKNNDLATLMGWLEDNYGQVQVQYIIDEITKIHSKNSSLDCMEIMLLADLVHGYRKEMLRQIKEFKALRKQGRVQRLVSMRMYRELKDMRQKVQRGLACWTSLRDDYFPERASYLERCSRFKSSYALEYEYDYSADHRKRA